LVVLNAMQKFPTQAQLMPLKDAYILVKQNTSTNEN